MKSLREFLAESYSLNWDHTKALHKFLHSYTRTRTWEGDHVHEPKKYHRPVSIESLHDHLISNGFKHTGKSKEAHVGKTDDGPAYDGHYYHKKSTGSTIDAHVDPKSNKVMRVMHFSPQDMP
jgi:hypothetical protein